MTLKKVLLLAGLVVAAALAACGGGSAGGAPAAVGDKAPVVPARGAAQAQTPAPSLITSLVLMAPNPTYAMGSEELAAFNILNTARSQCGFGKLAQSTQMDNAARAHNDYQIINSTISHSEDRVTAPIGFTGVTGFDRVLAAGYTGAQSVSDEFVAQTKSSNKVGIGERGMRGLLNAPYHMVGLLGGNQDVGISARSSTETSPQGVIAAVFLHVNTAYKTVTGPQLIGVNDVATYPCSGSIGIHRQLTNETPNPVPGRDLELNPIGSSVYILLREGHVLTITSAVMVETLTNAVIVLRTPVTMANDPHLSFKSNEGYVAPDAPLKALTQYSVDISGTNSGVPFTRQFIFTTGA